MSPSNKEFLPIVDPMDKSSAPSELDAECPLMTFALSAYNQERFICEAVKGAFSQTYSPLEIIISDDCSTDRTFEIIQEEVAGYRGPHKIILNRNKENLGIGFHLNKIMSLVSGFMVVDAAGDDISLPERTCEIYKAWLNSGKKAFSLGSACLVIDESGNTIDRPSLDRNWPQEHQLIHFSKTLTTYAHGATHAWHRKVFDVFGPLPNITCEDLAIPPRSMLLGNVMHISKALIKYRVHENNIYQSTRQRTAKEQNVEVVFLLNDRIKIITDVIRCINEYKLAIKDNSLICELDECVINLYRNKDKYTLEVKILTGYPIVRLYNLLKLIFIFPEDLSIAANAINKRLCRLSREILHLRRRTAKKVSKPHPGRSIE